MRPRKFALPQAGTGGYGIRPYVFCGGRSPLAEAVPRAALSPFVESEIRRGAFYMRPRRFILPQAGTGGYGIRPYVFCGGGEGHVFPCCVCRGDHWSPANLPPQRIFRDSFLVRQAGTGEQCSPLQMFFDSLSPKYSCPPHVSLPHRLRAEPPRRGGQERAVPRVEFSPFVGNVIRRGAFYMRPRKFILPQTGTGGYGIRPYVFETAEHQPSRA